MCDDLLNWRRHLHKSIVLKKSKGEYYVPKMKPDVSIFKRDVMVPIVDKIKGKKEYPIYPSSNNKTQIVKYYKHKHKAESFPDVPHASQYEEPPQVGHSGFLSSTAKENQLAGKVNQRNSNVSSIVERFSRAREASAVKKRNSLPFPNETPIYQGNPIVSRNPICPQKRTRRNLQTRGNISNPMKFSSFKCNYLYVDTPKPPAPSACSLYEKNIDKDTTPIVASSESLKVSMETIREIVSNAKRNWDKEIYQRVKNSLQLSAKQKAENKLKKSQQLATKFSKSLSKSDEKSNKNESVITKNIDSKNSLTENAKKILDLKNSYDGKTSKLKNNQNSYLIEENLDPEQNTIPKATFSPDNYNANKIAVTETKILSKMLTNEANVQQKTESEMENQQNALLTLKSYDDGSLMDPTSSVKKISSLKELLTAKEFTEKTLSEFTINLKKSLLSIMSESEVNSLNYSCDTCSPLKNNSTDNIENSLFKLVSQEKFYCKDSNNYQLNGNKYSWQDVKNWVPPSKKKNSTDVDFTEIDVERCKVKYSWQIIGVSTQTSEKLLKSVLNTSCESNYDSNENLSQYKCAIKYSWQIIGKSTQACCLDVDDLDYWRGTILTPNKAYTDAYSLKTEPKSVNKKILLNACIQTLADKNVQTLIPVRKIMQYNPKSSIKST
ncbi:putative leucine-rich repeat-containing protein DDB_G0290503 [Prorops nasuta]|uniref:putative leucine-rich repeat-containing protein DDB_G0290503 n=1 Tax=Prorops nasuta TaxID=863751 RepID=UPI0034CEBC85